MKYITLEEVCEKKTSNISQKDLNENQGNYPIYGASGLIKNVNFYTQEKEYIAIVKDGAGVGRTMLLPSKSSVIGTIQYIIPNNLLNIKYLYYAIVSMELSKYSSGATIPHIYFKDYKKEKIALISKSEQNKVVNILDIIIDIINKKKNQMELLEELVKSRFIEMFGDPIRNDKGWEIKKLVEVTNKISSGATPTGGKENYEISGISLIRSMNVHNGYFEYKDLAYISNEQARQLKNVEVELEDILLNITGASISRSCLVPSNIIPARVNQHVMIIRIKNKILNSIFLNNLFLNNVYKQKLINLGEANGATRQALTKIEIEKLGIILPPLSLQNEFAEFVTKTYKLKFEAEKSLKEMENLYESLMQKFFKQN